MPDIHAVIDAVNAIVPGSNVVGGSVRDVEMGIDPDDFDFITATRPHDIAFRCKQAGRRTWEQGIKFGTVGFKVEVDGEWVKVDVTTFRHEDCKDGGRHPKVTFVSDIEDDLSRHDFTVNAMAIGPDHKLVDPFGGMDDLRTMTLRAVGSPNTRFREDPLRMLRAARFAATKGFQIEEATAKAMKKHAHLILTCSKERWMQEMDKLLMGAFVFDGLSILWATGLMNFMIPELGIQWRFEQNSPFHAFVLHQHTALVVESAMRADESLDMLWAALLHDVGKPFTKVDKPDGHQSNFVHHAEVGAQIAEGIALRLKWSNKRRMEVVKLVREHLEPDSPLKPHDSGAQKVR